MSQAHSSLMQCADRGISSSGPVDGLGRSVRSGWCPQRADLLAEYGVPGNGCGWEAAATDRSVEHRLSGMRDLSFGHSRAGAGV